MYRTLGFAFAAATFAVASPAMASSVVYQSVADMGTNKVDGAYCADCSYYQGEARDQFTLGSAATVDQLNLWIYASGGFEVAATTGYTFNVYDSTQTNVLFSQLVFPAITYETRQGIYSQEWLVGGSLTGLSLAAGTYWAGFEAPQMGIMGFVGGNGSLTLGNGAVGYGDNAGYYLLSNGEQPGSVPEPASWAMMVGGFGLIGGALRNRRKASVTFA